MHHAPPRPILYSVTAVLPDEATLEAYLAWLRDGHIQAVLRAGAVSARSSRLIEPAGAWAVESQYVFATRDDFDTYIRDHAPALRAQGLARFGAAGVRFSRRVALLDAEFGLPTAPPERTS